jgi:hypothetical protein
MTRRFAVQRRHGQWRVSLLSNLER